MRMPDLGCGFRKIFLYLTSQYLTESTVSLIKSRLIVEYVRWCRHRDSMRIESVLGFIFSITIATWDSLTSCSRYGWVWLWGWQVVTRTSVLSLEEESSHRGWVRGVWWGWCTWLSLPIIATSQESIPSHRVSSWTSNHEDCRGCNQDIFWT